MPKRTGTPKKSRKKGTTRIGFTTFEEALALVRSQAVPPTFFSRGPLPCPADPRRPELSFQIAWEDGSAVLQMLTPSGWMTVPKHFE